MLVTTFREPKAGWTDHRTLPWTAFWKLELIVDFIDSYVIFNPAQLHVKYNHVTYYFLSFLFRMKYSVKWNTITPPLGAFEYLLT